MTPDIVKEIAERAAAKAAEEAAEKAIRATLMALGVDMDKLHEEQQVWAFARTMQQGTKRGVRALFTGFITALATSIAGWVWLVFYSKPHP